MSDLDGCAPCGAHGPFTVAHVLEFVKRGSYTHSRIRLPFTIWRSRSCECTFRLTCFVGYVAKFSFWTEPSTFVRSKSGWRRSGIPSIINTSLISPMLLKYGDARKRRYILPFNLTAQALASDGRVAEFAGADSGERTIWLRGHDE